MRLETILKAAVSSVVTGHHQPHCYSGPGLARAAQSEADNIEHAGHYSEPGYEAGQKGVLFANWNVFPSELAKVLERAGYSIEWSDEWSNCYDCGGAVRTSPDSYSWERSYILVDECSIVCHECIDWQAYCESIEDNASKAVGSDVDPAEYGYERLSDAGAFERGLHPGQMDDPHEVLKALKAQGKTGVLFRISGVGQFDVTFETWIKESEG